MKPERRKTRTFVRGATWLPFLLAACLAAALAAAAFSMSVETPFRLIDDYGDWQDAALFSADGFRAWLARTFVVPPEMRWRPFFELVNACSWNAFGTDAGLHHAFRWLLFLASFGMLLRSHRLAFRNRRAASGDGVPLFASSLVLGLLFLLYPNCPYARLAPQETPAVLFLSAANLFTVLLMRETENTPFRSRAFRVAGFSLSLFFLSLSKENCIAWLAAFTLFSPLAFRRRPRWEAAVLSAVPFVVTGFAAFKIACIQLSPTIYGHASVTMELVRKNAMRLFPDAFLFGANPVLGAVLVCLVAFPAVRLAGKLFRSRWLRDGISPVDGYVALLWLQFAAMSVFVCLQWSYCLRYWYVLVPSVASLSAVSVFRLTDRTRPKRRPLAVFLAGCFCFFFAACNGAQYLAQFSVQRVAGETERRLIQFVENESEQGRKILVRVGIMPKLRRPPEPICKFMLACGPFRERFPEAGPAIPLVIASTPPTELYADETYVSLWKPEIPVPESDQIRIAAPADAELLPSWFGTVRKLSAAAQFRVAPVLSFDAGAVIRPDYSWFAVRGPVPKRKTP